ncbi:hypothetical protein QCE49_03960 [Caballeronia sp. LZ008]|uniref:hypothetical protein n=1 Tax=unclassified Caballeronia TaxID=2646786 RepID=UPI0020285DB1|nr:MULTISPECIES: hypothetical protein [unclassified Caballeronia]MDR5792527.1 hypothetical protein [Caballeronia sp. LZ008]
MRTWFSNEFDGRAILPPIHSGAVCERPRSALHVAVWRRARATNAAASRFVGVSPSTVDNAKYAISLAIDYQLGVLVTSALDNTPTLDGNGKAITDRNGNPVYATLGADAVANPAGGGYLSVADAARLTWSGPNATISTDLKGVSAAAYDSLTFRVAVVRPMGLDLEFQSFGRPAK